MRDRSLEFEEALLAVDRVGARRALEADPDVPLEARLEGIVVPALERLGVAWEREQVALSQIYMAGRIAEDLISALRPPPAPQPGAPRLAITVLEDHHVLGKRLVLAMLGAAGVPVVDLGHTTVEELVERVCAERFDLVLISVLMLPSALRVRQVVEGLAARGRPVPLVVGGAPFRLDPELAARVGAWAYGTSAADAVKLVARFREGRP